MTAAEIRPRSPTRRGGQLCRPRVQRCADQLVMALAPCLARRTVPTARRLVWRFRIQRLCHANSSSSLTWRSCARSSGGLPAEQATAVPTAQELTAPARLALRGTPNAPVRVRNARGQPMTLVAWPLRRYRPLPTLPPPATRRLDCLISRIASGPRRSVRACPGRRRIFIPNEPGARPVNRRQLRHREHCGRPLGVVAAACYNGSGCPGCPHVR
jgi:hypothetical protein